jgi:DeoR/GlpR family transcriptional regulator of sugar metabolism
MATESERSKSAQHRRMEIIEAVLQTTGKVRTRDLADKFGIGQNLLANDINYLVGLGQIERGHGWVARRTSDVDDFFSGTDFSSRQSQASEAKDAIANYVARQLPDGGQALLDAGSTAFAVGARLASSGKSVEIITNNLALALLLAKHSSLSFHVVGGDYSREQAATIGAEAAKMIEGRKVEAAVLVPRALSVFDPHTARTPQLPTGQAVHDVIHKLAADVGRPADEIARQSLYVGLYTTDPSQPFRAMTIKNATKLFIALDPTKFLISGQCFFTIVLNEQINALTGPRFWQGADIAVGRKRPSFQAVRTRGPVLVRKTETRGESESFRTPDVDDPVDLREPGSLEIVTAVEEGDYPPAELVRLLRSFAGEPFFQDVIRMVRDTLVIVDLDGHPIPMDWVDRFVLV